MICHASAGGRGAVLLLVAASFQHLAQIRLGDEQLARHACEMQPAVPGFGSEAVSRDAWRLEPVRSLRERHQTR